MNACYALALPFLHSRRHGAQQDIPLAVADVSVANMVNVTINL